MCVHTCLDGTRRVWTGPVRLAPTCPDRSRLVTTFWGKPEQGGASRQTTTAVLLLLAPTGRDKTEPVEANRSIPSRPLKTFMCFGVHNHASVTAGAICVGFDKFNLLNPHCDRSIGHFTHLIRDQHLTDHRPTLYTTAT